MNESQLSKKRTGNTIVACYLLLMKQGEICLSLRKNTGYCDKMYGLISGHVEDGESASMAMIREAKEEAGIQLNLSQLKTSHILHRKAPDRLCIDIFFHCHSWQGLLQNNEPDKCEHLQFYPLSQLPPNTIDYISQVIDSVKNHQFYSEIGWSDFV